MCCGGKKKAEFSFEQEFSGAELNVEHPLGFQSGFIFFFPLIISVLVHKGGDGFPEQMGGNQIGEGPRDPGKLGKGHGVLLEAPRAEPLLFIPGTPAPGSRRAAKLGAVSA